MEEFGSNVMFPLFFVFFGFPTCAVSSSKIIPPYSFHFEVSSARTKMYFVVFIFVVINGGRKFCKSSDADVVPIVGIRMACRTYSMTFPIKAFDGGRVWFDHTTVNSTNSFYDFWPEIADINGLVVLGVEPEVAVCCINGFVVLVCIDDDVRTGHVLTVYPVAEPVIGVIGVVFIDVPCNGMDQMGFVFENNLGFSWCQIKRIGFGIVITNFAHDDFCIHHNICSIACTA